MIHYRMSHRLENQQDTQGESERLTVRRHHLKYVLNSYALENHCPFAIKVRVLEITPATAQTADARIKVHVSRGDR